MSLLHHQFPPFHPWKYQPTLDTVVIALWQSVCPGQRIVPNHDLGPIFGKVKLHTASATKPPYTNYFDPVTYDLQSFPFGHKLNFNLRLTCFDSWTDPGTQRDSQPCVPSHEAARQITGTCLSRHTRNRVKTR
ncbi:hypothetical protein UPYG_G00147100 [Umbra pygmaea]|uniref:Uncharacterized protein n=1 Tax=Umbra pygmaea TaxID=75934 RepID=A0ABD0XJ53_UMBPY